MTRRSVTSITEAAIADLAADGGNLIDYFRDGTSLKVARYKSGSRGPVASWFRVAVFDSSGKLVEKYDAREPRNALRRVISITRAHGGCR